MADKEYLAENPDYIDILERAIEFEEENKFPDSVVLEDTPYDSYWEYGDVNAHPNRVYQLEVNGFVERVMDTNRYKKFALSDREEIKSLIDEINDDYEDGMRTVMHDFPDEEELPDDLFEEVIGYDDVKWLLRRGMSTDKITNFLFLGPPGSAKTVFLMCIEKLGEAEFISAPEATGPGFIDVLFENEPKYMLLDELEDMPNSHQKSLSQYTETGIVKETKYGKDRAMKTNTKTLATANDGSQILDHIEDRFTTLEFEPYDFEEFVEVCEHVLPMKEDKSKTESRMIAEAVWDYTSEGDVRQAIQIARLSRGDPEKVIEVLDNYSSSKESGLSSLGL